MTFLKNINLEPWPYKCKLHLNSYLAFIMVIFLLSFIEVYIHVFAKHKII